MVDGYSRSSRFNSLTLSRADKTILIGWPVRRKWSINFEECMKVLSLFGGDFVSSF